ncbi:MAG: cytochrome c [Gammaproteobacteria bacterium]|nr:cytochrome c [Gammaproteobacteria bacterium]
MYPLLLAVLMAPPVAAVSPGFGWGVPASPEDIRANDYLVTKDGVGLPPGGGTALEGELLYRQRCEKCHGSLGRGASAEELVGGIGSLSSENPDRTIGSYWPYAPTLFDYIRRAMPIDAPLSLTDPEVYAVAAYLLYLNHLISETQVMDAQSLPRVVMPNRNGFVPAFP